VGRLESRYLDQQDPMSMDSFTDPQSDAFHLLILWVFLDFFHGALNVSKGVELFKQSAYSKEGFNGIWKHKGTDSWGADAS